MRQEEEVDLVDQTNVETRPATMGEHEEALSPAEAANDDDESGRLTTFSSPPTEQQSETVEEEKGSGREEGCIPRRKDEVVIKRRRSAVATGGRSRSSILPATRTRSDERNGTAMTDDVRLAISHKYVTHAVLAVLYAVLTDAMNLQCVAPNYPLLTGGAHPDSFPSIEPFGPTSAQYFISGCANGASFLSNLIAGYLSDRYGRRKILLINLGGSVIFTLAKYFARHSFWAYASMTFINGLFGSTVSVSLGYMADVFIQDRKKADSYLSFVLGVAVIGRSLGGLLTVLFPDDLFRPLWAAAFLTFTGFIIAFKYVLEPRGLRETLGVEMREDKEAVENEQDDDLPQDIDKKTLFNIILGATMDNAGSLGLIPLALTPLMFETFHGQFIAENLEPIMREQTYRWLYSMVAIVSVPGALIAPFCFARFGPALSCVLANLQTASVTIALLYVALITPPTTGTFALFATIMYVSVPFALVSQLSTGPMLDRITPLKAKGTVQGMNAAVLDGSAAIFPFLYAILADATDFTVTFWVAAGISVLAAISNLPLIFHSKLKKRQVLDKDHQVRGHVDDDEATVTLLDEDEMQAKLELGEFVPMRDVWAVNVKRLENCQTPFYTHPGVYKPGVNYDLPEEEYRHLRDIAKQRLIAVKHKPEHKEQIVTSLRAMILMDPDRANMTQQELGAWFSDYLLENGYFAWEVAPILKAMFQKSFPKLSDKTVTAENIEVRLVRMARLMNDYMEREGLDDDGNLWDGMKLMGQKK